MSEYDPTLKETDPTIYLRLPTAILRDLVLRSEENGHDIHTEIAVRLARTLERDLEMIEEDNQSAYGAFTAIYNKDKAL